jgi:hypothetical protein
MQRTDSKRQGAQVIVETVRDPLVLLHSSLSLTEKLPSSIPTQMLRDCDG